MRMQKEVEYVPDSGRRLSEEERAKLAHLYPWPRPNRQLCRIERTNDRWRLGRI
jgi:hypothetical protein